MNAYRSKTKAIAIGLAMMVVGFLEASPASAQIWPIRALIDIWQQPPFVIPESLYRPPPPPSVPKTDQQIQDMARQLVADQKTSRLAGNSVGATAARPGANYSATWVTPKRQGRTKQGSRGRIVASQGADMPTATLPQAEDLIARMKRVGLHQTKNWEPLEQGSGWATQFECFNGAAGEKLNRDQALKAVNDVEQAVADQRTHSNLNQTIVVLAGPAEQYVSRIQIRAKVVDAEYSDDTLAMGGKSIEALFDHPPLKKAFLHGQEKKTRYWAVEKKSSSDKTDPNGRDGYDVVAEMYLQPEIPNPESFFESAWLYARKSVKRSGSAGDAADYATHVPPVDAASLRRRVTYLGNSEFRIQDFLGNRPFTCVLRVEEGRWKTKSIQWGGEFGK